MRERARPDRAELDELASADVLSLGMLADDVRRARVGDRVTFVRVLIDRGQCTVRRGAARGAARCGSSALPDSLEVPMPRSSGRARRQATGACRGVLAGRPDRRARRLGRAAGASSSALAGAGLMRSSRSAGRSRCGRLDGARAPSRAGSRSAALSVAAADRPTVGRRC